jgi:hypothetical protein
VSGKVFAVTPCEYDFFKKALAFLLKFSCIFPLPQWGEGEDGGSLFTLHSSPLPSKGEGIIGGIGFPACAGIGFL